MAAAAALVHSYSNTASATVWTVTGCNLGAASSDRIIVVGMGSRKAAPNATVVSVTIGGVPATQAVTAAGNGNAAAIWYASVPDGTSATIEVTWSTAVVRGGFAVFAVTGSSGLGTIGSGTAASGAVTATFTPTSSGIAIASDYVGSLNRQYAESATAVVSPVSSSISITPASGAASTWTNATAAAALLLTTTGGGHNILTVATFNDAPSTITASAAVTLDPFTAGATGQLPIAAGAGVNLDAFTLSAAATVLVRAAASIQLDAFTAGASAVLPIGGAGGITLDSFTLGAAGALPIRGAAAITLDVFTASATGTGVSPPVAGAAGITLDPFTLSATAALAIRGSASITLDPFTIAATARIGPALSLGDVEPGYRITGLAAVRDLLALAMPVRNATGMIVVRKVAGITVSRSIA